jgi:hypothetical protein
VDISGFVVPSPDATDRVVAEASPTGSEAADAGAVLAFANDASSPPSSLSRVNHPINSVRIALSRSRSAVRGSSFGPIVIVFSCVGVGSGGAAGALAG